jgi:hypothetical protein
MEASPEKAENVCLQRRKIIDELIATTFNHFSFAIQAHILHKLIIAFEFSLPQEFPLADFSKSNDTHFTSIYVMSEKKIEKRKICMEKPLFIFSFAFFL